MGPNPVYSLIVNAGTQRYLETFMVTSVKC